MTGDHSVYHFFSAEKGRGLCGGPFIVLLRKVITDMYFNYTEIDF